MPFVNGEIYHVFNRGIDRRPTFTSITAYKRGMDLLAYYRFVKPPFRFSHLQRLPTDKREEVLQELIARDEKLVEILAFCLMPNHVHFLLKQLVDNGIPIFMSNFLNSYTRYFNTRYERVGSLFLDQFKGVRIETDEQMVHVSRYIHINPTTSFVVKDFEALLEYPWSSLPEYLGKVTQSICAKEYVPSFFKEAEDYGKFLRDQIGYQRELDRIKHLTFE